MLSLIEASEAHEDDPPELAALESRVIAMGEAVHKHLEVTDAR